MFFFSPPTLLVHSNSFPFLSLLPPAVATTLFPVHLTPTLFRQIPFLPPPHRSISPSRRIPCYFHTMYKQTNKINWFCLNIFRMRRKYTRLVCILSVFVMFVFQFASEMSIQSGRIKQINWWERHTFHIRNGIATAIFIWSNCFESSIFFPQKLWKQMFLYVNVDCVHVFALLQLHHIAELRK